MNPPDITLFGTDESAHRRRMVRDLELFLANALGCDGRDAGAAGMSTRDASQPVYSRPDDVEGRQC